MEQRFESASLAQQPDAFSFGICIKSRDWTIEHQNAGCISICGNQIGKLCQDTCWRLTRSTSLGEENDVGIKAFKNKGFRENACDVAIVFQEDRITSFVCPLTAEAEKEKKTLKARGLTNREIEIFQLRKRGFKNVEIELELGITRATLKTHIGNILKKISSDQSPLNHST
ncbi:MAG: helix-turn-helix transcriptional regulator [Bdellovibrionales bacterium]|nr:helix-turn-helix transcriptional regulator [Bdellovibrionales bacterium]